MTMLRNMAMALSIWLVGGAQADALDIMVRVQNLNDESVTLLIDTVQVRTRRSRIAPWEPWRRATNGGFFDRTDRLQMNPGEVEGDYYNPGFGCGLWRQVRATYICNTGPNSGSSYSTGPQIMSPPGSRNGLLDIGQMC